MDFGQEDVLDHATTKVLDRVGPGDRFGPDQYVRITDGRDDTTA
jgi:hypothetical protein